MDELERNLLAAWSRVQPQLARDADELHRRLARSRQKLLQQPHRAWCIALRASDTRLGACATSYHDSNNPRSHDFVVDSRTLRELCAPVHLDRPGQTLQEVAEKLGVTPHALLDARLANVFRTHHTQARTGKPTPLLYTDQPLNPQARSFAIPDPIWSFTSATALDRIPETIEQTLTRVPVYQDTTAPIMARAAANELHPEDPRLDPPQRNRRSRKLPPPQPDPVWYKWSTKGHFLGTDPSNWRQSPQDPGDRPRRDRPKRNRQRTADAARQGRAEMYSSERRPASPPNAKFIPDPSNPDMTEADWLAFHGWGPQDPDHPDPELVELLARQDAIFARAGLPVNYERKCVDAHSAPSDESPTSSFIGVPASAGGRPTSSLHSHSSLKFRGYRWQCPGCARRVNMLFYPLPRLTFLPLPARVRKHLAEHLPEPMPTFACEKCHSLKRSSRTDPNAWNEIVTYLSAAMLYGHEVQRPKWFPKPTRPDRCEPRTQVRGRSAPHASRSTDHASFQSHPHKRNRKIPYIPRPNRTPSKRRPQIEKLLLAGNSFKQIADALNLSKGTVLCYAQQVYKQHHVRTLRELLTKHGHAVAPPLTPQIRERILAGESVAEIAADLGVKRMMIYNQRQLLRKRGVKLPRAGARLLPRQVTGAVDGVVVFLKRTGNTRCFARAANFDLP